MTALAGRFTAIISIVGTIETHFYPLTFVLLFFCQIELFNLFYLQLTVQQKKERGKKEKSLGNLSFLETQKKTVKYNCSVSSPMIVGLVQNICEAKSNLSEIQKNKG